MAGENKNKVEIIPEIQGQVLKTARENLRLNPAELATKACLSKKHIIELEEGGLSSFYSPAHKVRVAKKVSQILGLDENLALVFPGSDLAKQETLHFDAPEAVIEAVPAEVPTPPKETKSAKKAEPVQEKSVEKDRIVSLESIRPSYPETEPSQKSHGRAIASIALIVLVAGGLYITKDDIVGLVTPAPKPIALSVEEQAAIQEEKPQDPAVAAVPATPPLPSEAGCPKPDASVTSYAVTEPTKSGNFVFVQAKTKQTVCVVDASGKSTSQSIEAGANHTFTGKAPFTVLTAGLGNLSIYFQGRPVRPSNDQAKTIKLEEAK
jgi:transcriptional regulator with XRE-family HTH domain